MSPEIWNDLRIRLRNIRGDIVGQWQGDLDNREIEQAITLLGLAIEHWRLANPTAPTLPPVP